MKDTFQFKCSGDSVNQLNNKLVLKHGRVNRPIEDVFKEKIVMVAYNDEPCIFEINNDTMVTYPWGERDAKGQIYDHAILSAFLDLRPMWQDNNYTWGWFDEDTGKWTGAVDMVSNKQTSKLLQ